MNIVNIEELAGVIAAKHQMSQQEAVDFVSAFFKHIRHALATEKLVKVRGLGTFSVTVMKSTEYAGRKCRVMTFSPETKLSKQVNKPFAQFEVVTLADGVSFDDVQEETGDDSLIKVMPKDEISVDDLPMVDSWLMVEPVVEQDASEELALKAAVIDISPAENTEADALLTSTSGQQSEEVENTQADGLSQDKDTADELSHNARRGGWWKWLLGAAVAACLVIGFLLLRPAKNTDDIASSETQEKAQTTALEKEKSTEAEENNPAPELQFAKENEMVKYGAYKIVGIDTIITVTPDMTLQRIATIFLGSEMQMYLSAMNDGNDNPQVGQQYKIPKLELK